MGWLKKYQSGGIITNSLKPQYKKVLDSKEPFLEKKVNKQLGDPQGKARKDAENKSGDGDEEIDNIRHASAGRYTAEAIANKTGNIPYVSRPLGLIGANVMGIGHELGTFFTDPRWKDKDWKVSNLDRAKVITQEALEDSYNNFIGSVIGATDMTPQQKTQRIKQLSQQYQLPDGYGLVHPYGDNPTFVDPYSKKKNGGYSNSGAPKAQYGRPVNSPSTDSLRHLTGQMMDYEATKGSPIGTSLSNWGYHQSQLPYNQVPSNWTVPQTKQEAVNRYMQEIAGTGKLDYYPSAMEKAEAGDFIYNTGRDPRVYMLDQYLKSKGQAGIPSRGLYNVDNKSAQWTPDLQNSLDQQWGQYQGDIMKLPTNDRRILMNKGRDFYYQNINKKADGSPNDSYEATWKPRIWESVNSYKKNGGYSTTGYKADSPDRNNPYNIIPSGRITMQNVPHPVLGIDNFGNKQIMQPGGEYQFQGDRVFEVPAMQKGGVPPIYVDSPADPKYKAYQDSLDAYNTINPYVTKDLKKAGFSVDTNEWNDFSNKIKDSKTNKKIPVGKLNKGFYSILNNKDVSINYKGIKPSHYIQMKRSSEDRPLFGDDYSSLLASGDDYWYGPYFKAPVQPIKIIEQQEERVPANLSAPNNHVIQRKVQQINRLPISSVISKSEPYSSMSVEVPLYSPVIKPEGWYTNNVNVPIDAEDVSALYNEDGSKKYKQGGMIKRADGSYSQRGLWDNIRANAGSGKKPTKEMLQQERKIRSAEKKQYGGPDSSIADSKIKTRTENQQFTNKNAATNSDFENYARIINQYQGRPNDTSYMYTKNTMRGNTPYTEQIFYNTGQNTREGLPVSNVNRGQYVGQIPTDSVSYWRNMINRELPYKKHGGWLNQYQEGGNWKADPTATIYSVPVKGKTAPVIPRPQDGVPRTMTAQEIAELERTENPIRKKIRTFDAQDLVPKSALHPENQLLGVVGDMVAYPVKAINSLTDPQHNYTGTPESNMLQYAMDVDAAVPLMTGIAKTAYRYVTKAPNSFISEINWGKWNDEIPDNKPLMHEYHTIEQTAKANGTWMKNPDGSAFQGTPEQFVQQNSQNFKKAFPEGFTTGFRGSHFHINDFTKRNRDDFATFLTNSRENALQYTDKDIIHNPNILGKQNELSAEGISEFMIPNNLERVKGNAEGRNWRLVNYDENIASKIKPELIYDHNDFNKFVEKHDPSFKLEPNKKYLSTDLYAKYLMENDKPMAEIENVIDGFGDYNNANTVSIINPKKVNLKSAWYNNGMFDMTNPNIYKTLLPVGLGASAISQSNNKQYGGWLNQYQNGGDYVDGVYNPSAGVVDKLAKMTPQQMFLKQMQAKQAQSTIDSSSPRRSTMGKAGAIARNPITAAQYALQGQPIPDYFEKGARNPYDYAADVLNPMTYVDAAKRTATLEHLRNMKSLQDLPGAAFNTAMDAGALIGLGSELRARPNILPVESPTAYQAGELRIPSEYMSLEALKGNMYGKNQVLVQQSRLLDPKVKAKFFQHQAPKSGPKESMFQKMPADYNDRITPENYEDFVNRVHGSTDYDFASAPKTGANLGIGSYGKPGMVYKDAPLNNLGKDIINAHEKNHGIFAGTLSNEMKEDLLKPFGTSQPIPHYSGKHQPDEVLARMAQFKNAVGIGDNQTFTLGHLNLIRKNYPKQFLDNGITEMLEKIKPGTESEKEFLKNMNKYAFGATGIGAAITASQGDKQKYGGWLKKYQNGGLATISPVSTTGTSIGTSTISGTPTINKNLLQLREWADQSNDVETPITPNPSYRAKLVQDQVNYVMQNRAKNDTLPFAVVDKKSNNIAYYDRYGKIKGFEPVITGSDNKDVDVAPSMKEFNAMYNVKGNKDYFNYLKATGQKITPAGIYTAHLRENQLDEPGNRAVHYVKNLLNPSREEEVRAHRVEAYGPQNKIFTLTDESGRGISKAIHGTGYDERIEALNNPNIRNKNLSNGCINVGGKTICFDALRSNSKVYILPEETDNIVKYKPTSTNTKAVPQAIAKKKQGGWLQKY